MHFIVLFGVIAKLAFVSGRCDVGTLDLSVFDITKFSGIWYWQYHNWNEYDDNIVCPAITFSDAISTNGRVTNFAIDSSTHRRVSFSGTVLNLDNVGYIAYDTPSMWSGRFNVLASDPDRYSIVQFCSEQLKRPFIYVGTRRECPDEATLRDVDRALIRYNLRLRQLVKWCDIC